MQRRHELACHHGEPVHRLFSFKYWVVPKRQAGESGRLVLYWLPVGGGTRFSLGGWVSQGR